MWKGIIMNLDLSGSRVSFEDKSGILVNFYHSANAGVFALILMDNNSFELVHYTEIKLEPVIQSLD